MQRHLVHEALLADGEAERFAWVSEVLRRSPPQHGSAVDPVRDVLLEVLTGQVEACPLPYELLRGLYERAVDAGDEALVAVLHSAPTAAVPEAESRLPREVADIPLGRRRSLARGDDPDLLERLARDPDPVVVRHVLSNPRTTEADVVRMASLRPVAPSTLVEIHRHPRWARRAHVRQALARNPYCPLDVAMQALGGVPLAELRDMRRDGRLSEALRAQVAREIERRSGARESG